MSVGGKGDWEYMNKKEREAQRKQEDAALNRALIWVGAAIVLEMLLMFVKRYYIDYSLNTESVERMLAIHSALGVLRIVFAVTAVAGAVWMVLSLKKGEKKILPVALTAAAAALAICAHVTLAYSASGMSMLFLLVPAWAGLALVYYLYQKDFFLAGSAVGLSVLGLWFVRFGGGFCLEAVVVALAIAAILAVVLYLKKQGGKVELAGQTVRILSKNTSYPVVLASCGAGLAAVAAALVLGTAVAYYLLFLMVAWLFGLLVYYTVKMM